ncbi:ABC transporter substrate-binding protein [Prosthecomicrobium hirschii]|uniref:Polyamine ABC transporter substrate-binding protein n=1 Tax=Prosthecodimorpha hirschii TaxID=665126 RepID=A0A0P6W7P2_9HYPH|nr:ABC transporter substrate-binding protein [Prosthecomicrobium hirschii]KPL53381.1 polyamine ABC transporter substrate-binding protein [Prosthecomicrobium hirschii]MCW1842437.1 ABC transporter substrate-binding protein [Prosthecomicrobium hirschii]TPQ50997.1 ABC transporter substrate-binding protein [Prosthecomicrobium hirschii]
MKRRTLLTAAVAAWMLLPAAAASAEEMVFASWGGAYQEAIRKAWLEPFAKASGVKFEEDTGPETAKIKAMVETKSVTWDIVTAGGGGLMRGVAQGLFEPITAEMVNQSDVLDGAKNAYGVPSEIFSTLIGFSTKAFPAGGAQPKTFADFFDVAKFPGKRTLPDKPETVLEAALLADGVPAGDVYKTLSTDAGMKRALDKIAALKPNVAVWWSSGAQPVQALGAGDVVMALGWNGRFQAGMDSNLPIAMSWDQQIPQVGYFMIPKGAPNKAAAVKFLNFILKPEINAELSRHVAYGPATKGAWSHIDAKRAERLPSTAERLKNALFLDIEWWAKNGAKATEAYTAMIKG